ncbi:ABC transporter permease [Phytoactinopolyspora alkaliphila]|uniref:Transport permease protein n=2 Tax=Phytoactinopolyspora alkaliphila TaxID=1783498 RepID=A0A6N9YFE1_9ACTN|nr:ABC transporter permease [Phytoactinopolyspora alkaliphila]
MWARAFSYWMASYRRIWRGSLVSGFLNPVLFLAAMGIGLGALVDNGSAGGVQGVTYLTFLAPGILAAQAMQTAVFESTFPVLGAVKWQRQYHAMLAAPLGVPDLVVGHLVFVAMRVAITSTAFLLITVAFGAIGSWWAVLTLPVAVLTGLAFAAPVFALAARQDGPGGFNMLFRFIIMPMFLFSGTFFPVEQLPAALELVAMVTPLWHAVELCRGLALETMTMVPALGHVAYLLLWVGAGLWLALASFRKRLVL